MDTLLSCKMQVSTITAPYLLQGTQKQTSDTEEEEMER